MNAVLDFVYAIRGFLYIAGTAFLFLFLLQGWLSYTNRRNASRNFARMSRNYGSWPDGEGL